MQGHPDDVGRIAKALREIAQDRGLSQDAFGHAVGEKQQTISKWFNADDDNAPRLNKLLKIETALGLPCGYIARAAGYVEDATTLREAIEAAPELTGARGAWRASVLSAYDTAVSLNPLKTPAATTKRTRK